MIQLKNDSFPSSILSLFVTRESALFAMVVKCHIPVKKISSKILTSLKKNDLEHFTVYLSMFSMKTSQILNINLQNFMGIFYGYRHKLDDCESSRFGS